MSEEVRRLDDFVTHDWQTGRWPKFLSLCVVYNLHASAVAGLLAAAAPMLLELSAGLQPPVGEIPSRCPPSYVFAGEKVSIRHTWWLCLGLVVFWLFFFTWPYIRIPWTRYLFVDKFCINQTDDDLKTEGILSLAGFLNHSDRLVMLWSKHYFSRLWCVYELAGWLHIGRDFRQTSAFMPVRLAQLLVWAAAVWSLDAGSELLFSLCVPWWLRSLRTWAAYAAAVHILREPLRELLELQSQVEAFSVRDSECFCCTHNHRHPETLGILPCDRKLVYLTLVKWFGHRATAKGSHTTLDTADFIRAALDAFDLHVRAKVGKALGCTAQVHIPPTLAYRDLTMLMVVPALVWLDALGGLHAEPPRVRLRAALHACTMCFCAWPCCARLILLMATTVARSRLHELRGIAGLALCVALGGIALASTHVLLMLPARLAAELESPFPQVAYAIALIAITVWSFDAIPRCRRDNAAEEPQQDASGHMTRARTRSRAASLHTPLPPTELDEIDKALDEVIANG